MNKLAIALLLVVTACSKKSDSSSATKPTEDPPMKTEPVKTEPVKTEPVKVEPKRGEASEADKKLISDVGDGVDGRKTALDWKAPSGDPVRVEVKQKVKGGTYVVDIVANGAVLDVIDSGVSKGDIHMEAHSAVKVIPEGVLVVVSAIKVTGKPANSYMGRVLIWDASGKKLAIGRKIEFDDVYDPATDG